MCVGPPRVCARWQADSQVVRMPPSVSLVCARWQVENHVVGAPCGIMDQMASALGQKGKLLALLCRPSEVLGCLPIPSGLALWGVDSGVRHALRAEGDGGSDYASVRTAAFMGRRIIQVPLTSSFPAALHAGDTMVPRTFSFPSALRPCMLGAPWLLVMLHVASSHAVAPL